MKKRDNPVVSVIVGVVVLYIAISATVFALRHPWMTKTEQFVYSWRMLTWGTVDYEEARPRR